MNFHPPFSEHLLSFFSYPSNIDLKHLNQALVLLYYYKYSPPISKSWIRACVDDVHKPSRTRIQDNYRRLCRFFFSFYFFIRWLQLHPDYSSSQKALGNRLIIIKYFFHLFFIIVFRLLAFVCITWKMTLHV